MNFEIFKEVGDSELRVLLYLHYNGGVIQESLVEISKVIFLDEQHIRRTTNRLVKKGFIKKTRIGDGRGAINIYTLLRRIG